VWDNTHGSIVRVAYVVRRFDIIPEQWHLGSEWCALDTGVIINIGRRMKEST